MIPQSLSALIKFPFLSISAAESALNPTTPATNAFFIILNPFVSIQKMRHLDSDARYLRSVFVFFFFVFCTNPNRTEPKTLIMLMAQHFFSRLETTIQKMSNKRPPQTWVSEFARGGGGKWQKGKTILQAQRGEGGISKQRFPHRRTKISKEIRPI